MRALWVRVHAPQTNFMESEARASLDTVYGLWIYAPNSIIVIIIDRQVIGPGAEAHLACRRDEELAPWVYVLRGLKIAR